MEEIKNFGTLKLEKLDEKLLFKMNKKVLIDGIKRLGDILNDKDKKYEELKKGNEELTKKYNEAQRHIQLALEEAGEDLTSIRDEFLVMRITVQKLIGEIERWKGICGRSHEEYKHYNIGNFITYIDKITNELKVWHIPKGFNYKKILDEKPIKNMKVRLYYDKLNKGKYKDVWEHLYDYLEKNKISYCEKKEEKIPIEDLTKFLNNRGYKGKPKKSTLMVWNYLSENREDWMKESEIKEGTGLGKGTINEELNFLFSNYSLVLKRIEKNYNLWQINIDELSSRYER